MQAHRVDATVSGDGSVTIHDLPFAKGERVEVIVLPRTRPAESLSQRTSLRGSVRRYERPFDAAADAEDWEAA